MIERVFNSLIEKDFFKGKVLVIVGARQVGKTTVVKQVVKKCGVDSKYL